MTDEDAFQAALDLTPADSTLRGVFADWLEERGDERCHGYRVLGELGLYPDMNWAVRFVFSRCWHPGKKDRSVLPIAWFEHLPDGVDTKSLTRVSRREAEDAAALAWLRLTPDERAAILEPANTKLVPH